MAWVQRDRWAALTAEQQEKLPPIAPDFVIELRSSMDDLKTLWARMQEYMENGVWLAWLINPQDRQVEVYRLGEAVEVLEHPNALSGEEVLPGLILNLKRIFAQG